MTVTLLGEKQNEELFRNAAVARDRLVRMAQRQNIKCEIVYVQEERKDALGHLEKYFFGAEKTWDESTEQIALYEAGTAFSEVEYVSPKSADWHSRGIATVISGWQPGIWTFMHRFWNGFSSVTTFRPI